MKESKDYYCIYVYNLKKIFRNTTLWDRVFEELTFVINKCLLYLESGFSHYTFFFKRHNVKLKIT